MKSTGLMAMIGGSMVVAALLLGGESALAQTSVAPSGEGTSEDPYQITQLGNLVWMGDNVGDSLGTCYRLMNDIDAAETAGWNDAGTGSDVLEGFMPIGADDHWIYANGAWVYVPRQWFRGDFNGDGHTIYGLTINRPYADFIGFFGLLGEEGVVSNLALVRGSVIGSRYVGGFAGENDGGLISRCCSSTILHGYNTCGGMVGCQRGGSIEQCMASGTVGGRLYGYSYYDIGGLGGYVPGGSVHECCSTVNVSGDESLGGLIANGWGDVSGSYWDMEASGLATSPGGGVGKTAAEMCQQATFAGWDFTNVWGIVDGSSTPYLRMFPPSFTLNVVTQGMGRIETVPLKATYAPGERVTLKAFSDAPGYVFSHWAFGASNQLTTVTTITVSGNRSLQAVFVEAQDISTVEELQGIGYMQGNYRLTQDIDATATTNWNSGAGFAPIGGVFTGIFDGNGHVIRGLTINRPGQSGIGLFQRTDTGCVMRRVELNNGSVRGGECVGTLAAYVDGGIFEECVATCDVSGTGYVGGLLGDSMWSSGTRLVKCCATGSVTAQNSNPRGAYDAGGLVGILEHGFVEDCYAMGNVSCANNAGGLIGESRFRGDMVMNVIRRCYSTGSATGQTGVGGMIGQDGQASLIRQCFSTGFVKGKSAVGCVIGYGSGYLIGQENGTLITSLGESYAVGRRKRIEVSGGALTGFEDCYYWNPTAYWDADTTWAANQQYTSSGRTTTQMKQQANYEGWDFENTWAIEEGVSYPYLPGVGTPFLLHVVADGPGQVTISPQKPFYSPGERVTLTAIPDSATNMLARWIGSVADEDALVTTVTMDIHKTVTAVFVTPKDISSIDALQRIGNDAEYPVTGNYRLSQDIDATATTNWNSGAGFAPIAVGWPGFAGVIDGQCHVVRGLTINRPQQSYVGLIGQHGLDGVIRNIGLVDCSVTGGSSVGGLVGYNYWGRVKRSFVDGTVCGANDSGGIVGRNEMVIDRCCASGSVTSDTTAGGIAGGLNYSGRIYGSYATAAVSGNSAVGGLVGFVAGYAYGVVTNTYWDVDASGCATSAGGEGRSTAQMRQQATFSGWDFATEWGIDEGAGYPFLWQFRLALPPGLGVSDNADRPGYAAWAATHTNAWGTTDFSAVPGADFEAAWLVDRRPAAGLAAGTDFKVCSFETGESDLRVGLALTASGVAKQGSVNGWLTVEGKAALGDAWEVVAGQPAGDGRIAFESGAATVTFARPAGHRFFRPAIRTSREAAAIAVRQVEL